PFAYQAVGMACRANPILFLIPCHRVIGKKGALTGFQFGILMKQNLLEHEQKYRHSLSKAKK
ncbi:MAG: methylated-DNA--[protein]-cysteine S-methyltransferase, partial [Vibrionaceae bacterium]